MCGVAVAGQPDPSTFAVAVAAVAAHGEDWEYLMTETVGRRVLRRRACEEAPAGLGSGSRPFLASRTLACKTRKRVVDRDGTKKVDLVDWLVKAALHFRFALLPSPGRCGEV